jgi:fucose 4-O-acetylase-like acetyltransferase
MPLFFLLSGLFVAQRVATDPGRFVRSSIVRIAWPYFLWTMIQSAIIAVAAHYVNHPPQMGDSILASLLWRPGAQFWFLYALFVMHLVSLLVLPMFGARALFIVALVALALAQSVAMTRVVALTCYFAPFYAAGVWLGTQGMRAKGPAAQAARAPVIGLAAACWAICAWAAYRINEVGFWSVTAYPAAIFGASTVLLLAVGAPAISSSRLLAYLGARSLSIYLMHVIFVAGARVALERLLGVTAAAEMLPILIVAGLVGPLLALEVFRRLGATSLLGLDAGAPPLRLAARAS